MISRDISEKILTLGCQYKHPLGGIGQVLSNYNKYVFSEFKCIVNSKKSSTWHNIILLISAIFKTIFALTIDRKIELVHIHTSYYRSFQRSVLFARIARLFGKKVVFHVHSGGFKEYAKKHNRYVQKHLHAVDAVIALSDSWKSYFEDELHCKHVFALNNVISPPQVNTNIMPDASQLHLLYLGLIHRQKGIYDLLDAIKGYVQQNNSGIILHIGGNGDSEPLKQAIRDNHLESNVFFHGWLGEDSKSYYLNLCDALVLPSYFEGLPMSIIEAFSYAKPVIATRVGAIPEIVNDGYNGLLISPGDIAALIEAIKTIDTQRDQLSQMSKNAKLCANQFLPENVSMQLETIYKQIIGC